MLRLKMVSGGVGLDVGGFVADGCKGIFVLVSGGGMAVASNVLIRFSDRCVYFVSSGEVFRISEGEIALGYLLSFDETYLEYFMLQFPLSRKLSLFGELDFVVLDKLRLDLVLSKIRVISGELERGVGYDHLKMAFSLFLLDIVSDRLVLAEPFDEGRRMMGIFKSLLEENFKTQRKSGFYADKMKITTRKLNVFCRVWYSGNKFDIVLRDRIMSEAEYMLLGTDEAIKVIVYELGFYSLQHFRGWFKRLKGVSPSVFRSTAQASK